MTFSAIAPTLLTTYDLHRGGKGLPWLFPLARAYAQLSTQRRLAHGEGSRPEVPPAAGRPAAGWAASRSAGRPGARAGRPAAGWAAFRPAGWPRRPGQSAGAAVDSRIDPRDREDTS